MAHKLFYIKANMGDPDRFAPSGPFIAIQAVLYP